MPENLIKNQKNDIADGNPDLNGLAAERALFLDKHRLPSTSGDGEIEDCEGHIRINNVPLSSSLYVSIARQALCKLYKDACTLKLNPSDIIGLRVLLGAKTDFSMELFFQPVILTLQSEIIDAELQSQGIFDLSRSGQIHNYLGSSFQASQSGDYTYRYQKKVEIKHNNEDGWGTFIPGKDVESVIFTFQEIFCFLHEIGMDTLKIFNCVRKFNTIGKGLINKHSLVLAENGPDPDFQLSNKSLVYSEPLKLFSGAYSNLTHLCPPNCSRLIYALERINY